MSILVTGGAGYIATHTIIYLLEKGESVVAVDNFNNSCPEAIARVKQYTGKEFPLIEADCCDQAMMEEIMRLKAQLAGNTSAANNEATEKADAAKEDGASVH